jgi:hypothetical protein
MPSAGPWCVKRIIVRARYDPNVPDAAIRTRALEFLAAARTDGGWPYLLGGPARPEPSVLAAAAGLDAAGWLDANRAELGWATWLVPAALSRGGADGVVAWAVTEILGTEGKRVAVERQSVDIDGMIPGWPWVDGTSAWVEPTAYAVISLKRAGKASHSRVADGEALLRDRQCVDGGWNYGNPAVNGVDQDSDLPPTGWATLALPAGPEADRGLIRLLDARELASATTLSVAILARVAKAVPLEDLADRLAARQLPDGSFGGRCDWTALAATALAAVDEGTHVFAV